jgi:DNA-binding LacI/PurR family transcriptional regulator
MPTIRDVAKRAGVAISTASAAINRSAPVSDAVIARVEEAVRDIGYVPHGAAQSLRSGQSRMIGLIVPNITNPHFSATARIIENVCLSAGYMSMVYSSRQDPERESQILKMMRQQRVAGLIIIPTASDAQQGDRLRAEIHVPTVLLDMYVEGLPYDVIKLDNVRATRLATEHLIGLGHRRIAVTTGIAGLATSEDRLAGYLEAHAAHGIPIDRGLLLRGDFDQQLAFDSVIEVMQSAAPPTAILSITNMMTLGVLLALRKLNLRVPDDVSFVGVDDFDFAEIMNPPPTVIRVPVAPMAERAITILLEEIASKRKPTGVRQVFNPELVVRESARAPRHAGVMAPLL